jgi:ABC-2 type transport system permease protein
MTSRNVARLPELAKAGGPRNVARLPEPAEAGGRNLFLHQLRYDVLAMRRNRRSQFFILLLPLMLLAVFAGLYGSGTVEVAGHQVAGDRASVPGVMSLAVLTGSFMALVMTVVNQREAGILKRRRAAPVPAAVLILSRVVTVTLSSLAAVAVMVVVADAGFGIDPPPGGLLPALLAVVTGSLCFACCGYAVASLVTSADSAQPILQVTMLPLQLLSGLYFPMSQLPDWLQHVANAFPLAHLTDALQHAWLPTGATVDWRDLGIMALWAVAMAFVAARRFKWLPSD